MPSDDILRKFRPYQVADLRRIGTKHDGGYVVHYPGLKDVDYLVKYGVGYDVTCLIPVAAQFRNL